MQKKKKKLRHTKKKKKKERMRGLSSLLDQSALMSGHWSTEECGAGLHAADQCRTPEGYPRLIESERGDHFRAMAGISLVLFDLLQGCFFGPATQKPWPAPRLWESTNRKSQRLVETACNLHVKGHRKTLCVRATMELKGWAKKVLDPSHHTK
jgi:hypothetical protein